MPLVHGPGQYLAFDYSGGIIQSVTDHTGKLSVQYSYQGEQLSGVVDVAGKKTNYSYLASGLGIRALSEVLQPDDTRLSYEYDANGRLTAASFNDTPQFTLTYHIGAVIVTNPIEKTIQSYFYDEEGNFVEYSDPLGRITKLKYNTEHALVGIVQPDGTSSSFKYDTKGNLIQHIDPLEQVTKFSYGAHNRLTGLTDAKVHTTAYGYDPSGNNTSRTSPDLTAQSYTYDPSGELVAKTNRRGTPTQIIRDYNGRILRIDYNDNTFVAYSYNSVGAIISVEDVTGITTME
ncbi:MAG: hypothetical protein OEV64_12385, partial [Desulfobulbaceae bacterium]|nr:hypothetical protein [Desulfobulbaceae bacterium]